MRTALLAQDVQYEFDASGGAPTITIVIWLAVVLLLIVAMWRMFTKAGRPGWASIVPIYNVWVMLKMVGRPGWWLVLYFIPIVNIVIFIMVSLDIAKSFGKGTGFGIGLLLLPFIFYPVLGFGRAQYQGPAAATAS